MEFRVLGPLEVVEEGRVLELGGRQPALVALLLLHPNESVSVDRIVDELWGEQPPPTAAKIVRNNVSLLRKELGSRLLTRPPGYVLVVENGELDSARLEQAIGSGRLDDLTEALALWRGPPLSQFAYEPFTQREIARLDELRLAAIEARIEAELRLGRHRALIPELEALVQQHPLREGLCAKLMLALYRSGRQADALDAYRATRRRLNDELGIEPGRELRDLERRILNQDASLGEVPTPEQPAPATRRLPYLVAAGVALVLASIAVVTLPALRDGPGGLSEVPPNYVGIIDPETNDVVRRRSRRDQARARSPPARRPSGSATSTIEPSRRYDPSTRAASGSIAVDDRTPTGLAAGPRAVWVAHGQSGELTRVEPRFRQATTVEVTGRPYGSPSGSAAIGAGYVWAAYGDSTLARIEPGSVRVSASALAGSRPAAVVVGSGAVWVANAGDATVQRFDPDTFAEGPIWTISVGRRPTALAYGEGAVWVANSGDDTVTRIDPSTRAAYTIPVGAEPSGLAVTHGAIWVANEGDGTVSRIDASTRKVDRTIRVGNPVSGVVASHGLVWVAVQAP